MAPLSRSEPGVADETNTKSPRKFTWKELSQLNRPENAHVAVRGKVSRQVWLKIEIFCEKALLPLTNPSIANNLQLTDFLY